MEVWEIMDMGRPLKNFDDYMDKLKTYAKACELEIVYRDEPGDGSYQSTRRLIILDKDLPESTEVATLLHELGHVLDFSLVTKRVDRVLNRAYAVAYTDRCPLRYARIVRKAEVRAWNYARSIAKRLRIPLGLWFDKEEADGLESYKTI